MQLKNCFVIAPIGDEMSPERKKVDSIIRNILQPVLGSSYNVVAAHQITKPGIITSQIVDMIFNSDLIVCDLSGVNGNVMYELAIAHLKEKQVLIVAAKGTQLPFDISHQRVIFYDDNISGSFGLKNDIEESIKKITDASNIDNPITTYLNKNKTSLVSEAAIKDTIKEAIYDAVTMSQEPQASKDRLYIEFEKNLDKPRTEQKIFSYLEMQKQFDPEKFYQYVCSAIEQNKFPVQTIEIKKDFSVGNGYQKMNFDYLIKTKDNLLLAKISPTLLRISIQKEAHRIIELHNELSEIEGYSKNKIQPIFIVPSGMEKAGKLVAQKVPLLKFDSKTLSFTNWQVIIADFSRIHSK